MTKQEITPDQKKKNEKAMLILQIAVGVITIINIGLLIYVMSKML